MCKENFKNLLLNLFSKFSDDFAIKIQNRIAYIPDLLALGTIYYYDCMKRFYLKNKKKNMLKVVKDKVDEIKAYFLLVYRKIMKNDSLVYLIY